MALMTTTICSRHEIPRRSFLWTCSAGAVLAASPSVLQAFLTDHPLEFAVNERSLHQALQQGSLHHLNLAEYVRDHFGIDAVEYASSCFSDRRNDADYLKAMNRAAAEHNVRQLLIAVDDGGPLAAADPEERSAAIAVHREWIDAARTLGCFAIRITLRGDGTQQEQLARAASSISELALYGTSRRIHILITNDRGLTASPEWLVSLIKRVDSPYFGTLPDFVHFSGVAPADGLKALMPYARGVRILTRDFDDRGNVTAGDIESMLNVVFASDYRGRLSIEYSGTRANEEDGVKLTCRILERAAKRINVPEERK
ncbi:TIM barrel protein [bacterium]|nr:TIM barrel protein [bacterium]